MAKIDPSPIKVNATDFRLDDNGNLEVDISRDILVNDVQGGSGLEKATRQEAADGVGEPKEGYVSEDIEFDIYFGGEVITKYTKRFYYKVTEPAVQPQDRFKVINVLLSRSTSNPCQDLTSNNLVSITLYYDKKSDSPYNTRLYTQQVKDNEQPAPFLWSGTDNNDNQFQWAQFPDTNGGQAFFYKINHPGDDVRPDEAYVEILNSNADRKSCNTTRTTYPISLFLAPNYSDSPDVSKAMVCSPSYSGRGVSFNRQTIEVFVLQNPNSDGFSLYQQTLFEEDGVTPIHPLRLNVFGSIQTNNFVVKVADDEVAPYYYLGESTITTPLYKNVPCYRVGNQLDVCFIDSTENPPRELTDCEIIENNLIPGSEGGPPEDKITATCKGVSYTWNGTQWYEDEEQEEGNGNGTSNPPSGGGPSNPPNRTRGTRTTPRTRSIGGRGL